ncbi:MAG TPA: hypothetical protein VG011_10750, partial [Steroidobacteraceae bacterium]|nr:hypothetical protein [Steroidobacteraceae bacterium]
ATAPASIARPACSSTRCIVPDNHNKFAIVVTRARVDPRVFLCCKLSYLYGFGASPSQQRVRPGEKIRLLTVPWTLIVLIPSGKSDVVI